MREIATGDGLATLHFDHENWEHWVDFHPENTGKTRAEVLLLLKPEGLIMLDAECEPEHIEGGLVRHHLGYLEVAECP